MNETLGWLGRRGCHCSDGPCARHDVRVSPVGRLSLSPIGVRKLARKLVAKMRGAAVVRPTPELSGVAQVGETQAERRTRLLWQDLGTYATLVRTLYEPEDAARRLADYAHARGVRWDHAADTHCKWSGRE